MGITTEISDRKREANRANAQRSTGPRTAEGKSRSRMNALAHGLCAARDTLLPGESEAEFLALRDHFLRDLNPSDAVEMSLVERMVSAKWKLRRVRAAEGRGFTAGAQSMVHTREDAYRRSNEHQSIRPAADRKVAWDESLRREKSDWIKLHPGDVVACYGAMWEQLARYEQRYENQFHRALRELMKWRKEKRSAPEQYEPLEEESEMQNEPTNPQTNPADASRQAVQAEQAPLGDLGGLGGSTELKNEPNEPQKSAPIHRVRPQELRHQDAINHEERAPSSKRPVTGHR